MNFKARLPRITLLAALAISLSATGCKSGPSLVGKWTSDQGPVPATLEFKPDNSLSIEVKQPPMTMSITGTYKLEDKTLTTTTNDIKIQGLPAQFEAIGKKQAEALKGKVETSTIVFKSDDEITVTGIGKNATGKPQTLKRVKDSK